MKSKLTWASIVVFGVIVFGMPVVYAADVQPEPVDFAHQQAMDDHIADLDEIAANREAVIEELVQLWFMDIPDWEAEFRSLLNLTNDSKLLVILNAKSYAEVQAVLAGGTPDFYSADSMADPFTLGDTDKDFVYTPVKPCRIIDTREAGGKIPSGDSRSFYVYGNVAAQGGNSAGCPAPRGEPRAVHMNIVAVNSVASGWLTVWPTGTGMPLAGILNYYPGRTDPVSNAFTVKTGFGLGRDINVYAHKTTHVVADVMGYYYDVDEDDFKVRLAGWVSSSKTSLTVAGGCTNQNGGRVSINVPGPGKVMVTVQAMMGLKSHTAGTMDMFMLHIGASPTDCTYSDVLGGYNQMGISIPANEASWYASVTRLIPISVSRIFTVSSAATKTYYINGRRLAGTGELKFWDTGLQAVYYPDR